MEQRISGGRYAFVMGTLLGIYVAITVAFPYLVSWYIQISDASRTGGASGANSLVIWMIFKPIIYLLFAFSTLPLSLKRAKAIGLPPLIGLFIPLLILGDYLIGGATFINVFSADFSFGVFVHYFPASLMSAIIAGFTLSMLPIIKKPMTGVSAIFYAFWIILLLIGFVLSLMGILGWLGLVLLDGNGREFALSLLDLMSELKILKIYPFGFLFAFAAASVAFIVTCRFKGVETVRQNIQS